jgi:hypothetical protein
VELLYILYKEINILSESLQKSDLDLQRAYDNYRSTIKLLENLIEKSEFDKFYENTIKISQEVGIDIPTSSNQPGRKRNRSSIDLSPEPSDIFKVNYTDMIKKYIEDIKSRFNEDDIKPILAISNIILNDDMGKEQNLRKDLKLYKDEIDFEQLDQELPLWYNLKKQYKTEFGTRSMQQIAHQFNMRQLKVDFKEIFK